MRPFRRMALVLALLLGLLIANLTWVQVLNAESIRQHPDNTRNLLEQYNKPRGPILVESTPIAVSRRATDTGLYQRSYVDGPMYSTVTGYFSLLYGATGIEQYANNVLSGNDSRFFVDRVQQLFAGRKRAVGAVTLSVSSAAQRAAYGALQDHVGAIVAIAPKTGAILAMSSGPSFDPQVLAPNHPEGIRPAYDLLKNDKAQPLLNRAIQRTYSPSAAFNLVTVSAALSSGKFTLRTLIPGPAEFVPAGATRAITNRSGKACSASGSVTVAVALESSCTTAIAWLGSQIGTEALRSTAEQFGFESSVAIPLNVVPSRIKHTGTPISEALTATGALGVRVTPMQMAMVGASIANAGTLMQPYLVHDVRGPDLSELDRATPKTLGTPVSARAARALMQSMQDFTARHCATCDFGGVMPAIVVSHTAAVTWAIAFTDEVAVAVALEGSSASSASDAATSVIRAVTANS